MKRRKNFDWVIILFLMMITTTLSFWVLSQNKSWIGKSYPGYLAFENGVVGAFYMPGWEGVKTGKTYRTLAPRSPIHTDTFEVSDYLGIVVVPVVTGFLFFMLGLVLMFYAPKHTGKWKLLFVHFLIANYLILSPDFHMSHLASLWMLAFFSLIPAVVISYAQGDEPLRKFWKIFPWAMSFGFLLLHIYAFKQVKLWLQVESLLLCYFVFSYAFWLWKQFQVARSRVLSYEKILAKYMIRGQVLAFIIPLIAAVAIFVGGVSIPLNLLCPVILVFPVLLFVGMLLSRLQYNRLQWAQIERRSTLGNLVTGLAHELNNPLNFIGAALDPIRERVTESMKDLDMQKDTLALVDIMQEGVVRATKILEGFRLYAHPGSDQRSKESLHDILDQSISMLAPQWGSSIEVQKEYSEDRQVMCNKVEIGQIFMNLLINAAQSMHGNGIIKVKTQIAKNAIQVQIQDQGMGMSEAQQSRIFDPFYTTKDQGEGTGLGLSIVSELTYKHDGQIQVSSEKEKGTTFMLTLPTT